MFNQIQKLSFTRRPVEKLRKIEKQLQSIDNTIELYTYEDLDGYYVVDILNKDYHIVSIRSIDIKILPDKVDNFNLQQRLDILYPSGKPKKIQLYKRYKDM